MTKSDTTSPLPRGVVLIVLGALVGLGAVLRFYAIARGGIWMDEATSIDFARMPLGSTPKKQTAEVLCSESRSLDRRRRRRVGPEASF